MKPDRQNDNYLSLSIIIGTKNGDDEATSAALKKYEGYICQLSKRKFKDEFGRTIEYVDEDTKRILEIHLSRNFHKFDFGVELN